MIQTLSRIDTNLCKRNAYRKCSKSAERNTCKSTRAGNGTHSLVTIKKLLLDKENWQNISEKCDYQFPGVFSSPQMQGAFYSDDCKKLPQSGDSNPHFLLDDIQVSKGSWNKDREITVTIDGKVEKLMYRVAPCYGVKLCSQDGCDYVVRWP